MLANIDLTSVTAGSAEELKQAQNLHKGFMENGFITLTGHGITADMKSEMLDLSKVFFASEYKNELDLHNSPLGRGYEMPTEREYKESFMIGLELDQTHPYVKAGLPFHGINQWPNDREFQTKLLGYQSRMIELTQRINRLFALSLGCSAETINDRVAVPHCMTRLLHYKAQDQQSDGIAAHTDWGCLSLIIQDENNGLEILDKQGNWQSIHPKEDQIVVNVGNIAEILSGGLYPSTLHRVPGNLTNERYSIAFFCDLDYFTSLKPLCPMQPNWKRYEDELDRPSLEQISKMTVADYVCLMHERDFGISVERPNLSQADILSLQAQARDRNQKRNSPIKRAVSKNIWNIS